MRITRIETDPAKENNGTMVPFREDCRLKIARATNATFRGEYSLLMKPHILVARASGGIDQKTQDEINRRAMAKGILLGWENLEDKDGKAIPYSEEKAYELLRDYSDLYQFVNTVANEADFFRNETIKSSVGNS